MAQILAEKPKWIYKEYFQFKLCIILFLWMFAYLPVAVQAVERYEALADHTRNNGRV